MVRPILSAFVPFTVNPFAFLRFCPVFPVRLRTAAEGLTRLLVGLVVLGGIGGVCLSSPAQAQRVPARLDAYATADSVAVGERFTLVVTAEHGFAIDVTFPPEDAGPLIFGDVQVIGTAQRGERYLGADGPGAKVDSVLYTVATFALDSARVPSLPVEVVLPQGDTLTGGTPPVVIPVRSTLPADAEGLRDLTPLVSFPQPTWPWMLLGIAIVSLVGLLAYLFWVRRSTEEEAEVEPSRPAPEVPPHARARSELRALRDVDLTDRDTVKPFYVRLSATLRSYLGQRLDMRVMERTTREVVRALQNRADVPPAVMQKVQAVLELADLVKFSQARSTPEDGEQVLRRAEQVVDDLEARRITVSSAERTGGPTALPSAADNGRPAPDDRVSASDASTSDASPSNSSNDAS